MTEPFSLADLERVCPKCGGEFEHRRHRFSTERGPNLPDADWDECQDCGWQSDPE